MLHAHCCLRGEDERRKIKQARFLLLPAESSAVGTDMEKGFRLLVSFRLANT